MLKPILFGPRTVCETNVDFTQGASLYSSRISTDEKSKQIRFEVVGAAAESGLGFDPRDLSKRGSCVCPFCQTAINNTTAMKEGEAGRLGIQPVAIGAHSHRIYVSQSETKWGPPDEELDRRLEELGREGFAVPAESIPSDKRESFWCRSYGLKHFKGLLTKRQPVRCSLSANTARLVATLREGIQTDRAEPIACYLGLLVDRVANQNNSLCIYSATRETVEGLLASKRMGTTWDFVEANSKVEHVFQVMKYGFVKVLYRGLKKNARRLFVSCALVNPFVNRRKLLAVA